MNSVTYVMYVVLLITVIFVIYFLMLGSRITKLEKKYEELNDYVQGIDYRIGVQFHAVHECLMDLEKGQN